MSTNNDKYLVLRGKNKDIYFIQKRVSKKVSSIIGKDFIKKSLETSDINVARAKRDEILKELLTYESSEYSNEFAKLDKNSINTLNKTTLTEKTRIQTEIDDVKTVEGSYSTFKINELEIPTKESIIKTIDAFIPISLVIITLLITYLVG
ncbi:MAG: hypothetical protein EVA96_01145 [SAR86 cluster bacterium]|uniref:Uncharacterized protein n=1 Tax=SAR86 cluster bacterium TaxID=2030880 RepID=A0A520MNI7_9GAMM|nr:MAG: hypothetical protein EVA96_01145 [SAR86 cluster bacterium]